MFFLHTFVLLKKNAYVFWRNRSSTASLLLGPCSFVFLLWFFIVITKKEPENPYPPAEYTPFPSCVPWNGRECYDLVVIGAGQNVDDFTTRLSVKRGITGPKVKRFANTVDFETFVRARPNTTYTAIAFTGPELWNYTLYYNATAEPRDYSAAAFSTQIAVDTVLLEMQGKTASIQIGKRSFPKLRAITDKKTTSTNTWGPMLFYLTVALPFVIMLIRIVNEKERKLRLGLAMMGMQQSSYWAHWIITVILVDIVVTILVYITVQIFRLDIYCYCNFFAFLAIFFCLHLSHLGFLIFISSFVSTTKGATSVSFAYAVIGLIICLLFNEMSFVYWLFADTSAAAKIFRFLAHVIFPQFHFCKTFHDVGAKTLPKLTADGIVKNVGFSISDLREKQHIEFGDHTPPSGDLRALVAFWIVYSIVGIYLDAVLKGETGLQRPLWFFLTPSFWGCGGRREVAKPSNVFLGTLEEDVRRECEKAFDGSPHTVKVLNLRKVYGTCSKKEAVKGVSFAMEKGELFGILGHNGAGKTTTISMLVGLHRPTSGQAFVDGTSIDDSAYRNRVGVCPQHDILWDELTPYHHLTIFSQFKGLKKVEREEEITRLLAQVQLEHVRDKTTQTFSGGMKRRLSVAVANIGNPTVIFLDEPTTGMDPHSRRQVWQLIQTLKETSAVVLTTHSMEEADALSDRVAVMAKGQIRCIGSSLHLKEKFGMGYEVKIVSSKIDEAMLFVQRYIPGAQFVSQNAGSLIYQLPVSRTNSLPDIIDALEHAHHDDQMLIKEWGVSPTTLEEVYLSINKSFHVYEQAHQPWDGDANSHHLLPARDPRADQSNKALPAERGTPVVDHANCYPLDAPRSHRQFIALFKKNASFNKRQPCAICCFIVFPILIILMLVGIRALVSSRLDSTSDILSTFPRPINGNEGSVFQKYSLYSGLKIYSYNFVAFGTAFPSFGTIQNGSATGPAGLFLDGLFAGRSPLRKISNFNQIAYPSISVGENSRTIDNKITDSLRRLQSLYSATQGSRVVVQGRGNDVGKGLNDPDPVTGDPSWWTKFPEFCNEVANLPTVILQMNTFANDTQSVALDYVIQINTMVDTRVEYMPKLGGWNSVVEVQASILNAMVNVMSKRQISMYVQAIPSTKPASRVDTVVDIIAKFWVSLLFIMPLSFFTYHIVYEKQFKTRELSKINAMDMKVYWLLQGLYDFFLYCLTVLVMTVALAIIKNRWIRQTSPLYLFLLFLGSAISIFPFSIFLSAFCQKATSAMILGVMVTLALWIIGLLDAFTRDSTPDSDSLPPPPQLMVPSLSLVFGIETTNSRCASLRCVQNKDMSDSTIFAPLLYLYLFAPVWLFIGLLLDSYLPNAAVWITGKLCNRKSEPSQGAQNETGGEDADAQEMSREVHEGRYSGWKTNPSTCPPIVLASVHKEYTKDTRHIAVHHLDLAIEEGVCFGLLGPNGAGKSTTIHMLSGMIRKTSGNIFINGLDIDNDLRTIRMDMGICPQHDIHWGRHLTVREHLLYIARLKGIPRRNERAHVKYWMERVKLTQYKNTLPHKMSGGEQRRLSIAMALVGNGRIVFFDEPTTGLDPSARRIIWDIIMAAKPGRCIILTTHSMEEAEVLSDVIGIMALGRLRCVGSPLRLKLKYGKGYRVTISFNETHRRALINELAAVIGEVHEIGIYIKGQLTAELTNQGYSLRRTCEWLVHKKASGTLLNWSLSQTTLEDVFLEIIGSAEALQGQPSSLISPPQTTGYEQEMITRTTTGSQDKWYSSATNTQSPSFTPYPSPYIVYA